ncbi:hypothetical protein N431DRAFT_547495 [Stipitochalara longipes BDJ]|nr:hypothetical protein N431DRAFT_547495 [Stipitochalara longipes BDJ]
MGDPLKPPFAKPNPCSSSSSHTAIFSRFSRASLQWTGFTSLRRLILFLSTVVIFALFSMSQTTWMRPQAPGGKFWFETNWWLGWGLRWHVWLMIPVGILLPFQFVPRLRTRNPALHRWLGRLLIIAVSLGNVGGMIATRRSFGGTIAAQTSFGMLVIISSFSIFKAWVAIRERKVDRHRVWMLRAWSYICSVLTLRILMAVFSFSIVYISPNRYKTVSTCAEVLHTYETLSCNFTRSLPRLLERYPSCIDLSGEGTRDVFVAINASLDVMRPEEIFSMLSLVYGTCAFLGLMVHMLGVELYLEWSKFEDERLRKR